MFSTILKTKKVLLLTRLNLRVLDSKALIDGSLLLLTKIMSKSIGMPYPNGKNTMVVSKFKEKLVQMVNKWEF